MNRHSAGALLLLVLWQLSDVGSSAAGDESSAACAGLFANGAVQAWRKIVSPATGESLAQAPGELLDVSLTGDPGMKLRGAAAVLLLDGALVAYGGGWEEDDTLVLPSVAAGAHRLTLGVVSDTGGATWKRDTDLCVVQTTSFIIEEVDGGLAGLPWSGAVGAITWPRHAARLLASEVHLLRFTLRESKDISFECNGQQVREVSPYDAGEHQTLMDFLPDARLLSAAGGAPSSVGDVTVVMVVWEDEGGEGTASRERQQVEQVQVAIKLVDEVRAAPIFDRLIPMCKPCVQARLHAPATHANTRTYQPTLIHAYIRTREHTCRTHTHIHAHATRA
jgi:hypothetical protein